MTLRIALALVLAASVAQARPSVTVAPDAPFTEHELGEALALRIADDVDVHVTRDRDGRLVVAVRGKQQIVDPAVTDARDAARVVAMVVIALVEEPAPAVAPPSLAPNVVPVVAAGTVRRKSPYTMRVVGSAMRDDNGFTTYGATASLGYYVSPSARLVAAAGVSTIGDKFDNREIVVPIRLGVEGIAGALGLELGAFANVHRKQCESGLGAPAGVYGTVRVYLPARAPNMRLVVEGGGQYVLRGEDTNFNFDINDSCREISSFSDYAGWVGLGAEWSL